MTTHFLKCNEPWFTEILEGKKTFELRKSDRSFVEGDLLELRQVYNNIMQSRYLMVQVKYVLRQFDGLMPGYCILGIQKVGFGYK